MSLENVYIIIVTYNAMPWLDKCLGSIDFDRYKVVVVDNCSEDETITFIQDHYPSVKLFVEQENLGFGQGNNKGISYALNQGAERVFLLNQDAYLVEDCLEKLIEFQKNNSEFGILSPIHTNSSLTRLDRNFSNYVRFDKNPDFYSDFVLERKKKTVYRIPFINAAGWLLSKKCLMTVGGFDPIFFHYGEDRNYAQRVLYHGLKIGVVPKTFMIHDREDKSTHQIEKWTNEYFQELEKNLKVKFADINNKSSLNELNKSVSHKRKIKFILQLKGRFKRAIKLKKNIQIFDQIIPQIKKSIKLNKKKQPNYLDI